MRLERCLKETTPKKDIHSIYGSLTLLIYLL